MTNEGQNDKTKQTTWIHLAVINIEEYTHTVCDDTFQVLKKKRIMWVRVCASETQF